jgi:hypothetical protein
MTLVHREAFEARTFVRVQTSHLLLSDHWSFASRRQRSHLLTQGELEIPAARLAELDWADV